MQFRLPKTSSLFVAFGILCHSEVLMAQNAIKPCIAQKTGLPISASLAKVTANKPLANQNVANESSTIDRQPSIAVKLSQPINNLCSIAIFDEKSKEQLTGQWTDTSPDTRTFKPNEALTLGNYSLTVALKSFDGVVVNHNKLAWKFMVADSQTIKISATPTSQYDKDRLRVTYPLPDFIPTGLEAAAGSKLIVYVNATDLRYTTPKLIIGTPGLEGYHESQKVVLKSGFNEINVKDSGLIYASYTKSSPPFGVENAEFTITQGFSRVPYYRLGKTTNIDWKNQLKAYSNAKKVVQESDRAMLVFNMDAALRYQNDNQDLTLRTYDSIIKAEDDLMGLDNSYPNGETDKFIKDLNSFRVNKFLIVQTQEGCDNLYANEYFVGVPYVATKNCTNNPSILATTLAYIEKIMFTSAIKDHYWGAAHEIGHQHQQLWMKWIGIRGEVTENIYALAAKRELTGNTRSPGSDVDVKAYLNKANPKDFSKLEFYDALYMYHQLWLAYGDNFYINLHKLVRASKSFDNYESSSTNLQAFILYSSVVSGDDLTDFFSRWGWDANAGTVGEINQLGLQKPKRDPSTFFN